MALPTLTVRLGENGGLLADSQHAIDRAARSGERLINFDGTPYQAQGATPKESRLKPIQLRSATPTAPVLVAHIAASSLAATVADYEAQRETKKEIAAWVAPSEDSPDPTLAQLRAQFLSEQIGPALQPFDCQGEQVFARRLNFGESLCLALILPLTPLGYLDASRPDDLANAMAEILRVGLMRDANTPYFVNKADAVAFVDDDATAVFAADAVMAIDLVNKLLPRQPQAPRKTRAQERIERLTGKNAAAAGEMKAAPKRARKPKAPPKTEAK